ncbi:CTQ-dependent lysine 6-oxidase LodA [Aureibacter tunicatorum]|uniref:L-lysine 6-oxidase n=1 Tax=Aureibacter tunicatorum TaxID=866807 RepID=A0AAE4BRA7_9BACT|nr:CTQ-dependent lysine 6-oxidase LodA [Aureibacter tunicatorum]MDR6238466.1 L-lysine 6-oxidase [Aureibacter tunicatorum]
MKFKISPSVGVARLGNSTTEFYLAPEEIGGLPFDCDEFGNKQGVVTTFKDELGRVKRQGQVFKVFDENGVEITMDSPGIKTMEWTVHLANKKAAWYEYSELQGNLLFGEENSYENQKVPLRNETAANRQELIIDPGPRSLSGKNETIEFDKESVPETYKKASFPSEDPKYGSAITTLGSLKTDNDGRLIVIGAYGNAGGDEELESYGGADTWHDDIADGPVYCTISFDDDNEPDVTIQAWAIVGSPDYAPEIVNISTLSDTMFDVGVRAFDLVPDMFSNGKYNDAFRANYHRDILPIIKRIGAYQWVANVQSMTAFTSNIFDFSDNSTDNLANRQNYFAYFRALNDKAKMMLPSDPENPQPQEVLFKTATVGGQENYLPMMPMNSGSNSVSNILIEKFLALNETQFFLLGQWAEGKFDKDPQVKGYPNVDPMDEASVGNCVGLPMCPGIEVTWSLQNPIVFSNAFTIYDQKGINGFNTVGLDPGRDECEGGGCQPGDLTKRMACPWQADFFNCTLQLVNFTDPNVNKVEDSSGRYPKPPTYYSYWWPPQSPWDVLSGELTVEGQAESHLPAGQQVNYARGINSFVQMVEHWSALAFIRNNNSHDQNFPFFTEVERNHEIFSYKDVPVGDITGNEEDNGVEIPVFYIDDKVNIKAKNARGAMFFKAMEQRVFKKISVVKTPRSVKPRSGTRTRR